MKIEVSSLKNDLVGTKGFQELGVTFTDICYDLSKMEVAGAGADLVESSGAVRQCQ